MEPIIEIAAQALVAGDALGALNWIALRDDAPALALRGIAMAQLGDLARARELLKRAAAVFASSETVARSRCIVAEAEIAFASRELNWQPTALESARSILEEHGDRLNAAYARLIAIRRLLLIGRGEEAERQLTIVDPAELPPPWKAAYELSMAGLALHRVRAGEARAALDRALIAARTAGIPSLCAEIENTYLLLSQPVARVVSGSEDRLLQLEQVEDLLGSGTLIIDACRSAVRNAKANVSLSKSPVLFSLARALAEAWPADVPRSTLVECSFQLDLTDDDDRLRLRVEIGRLRKALRPLADVIATKRGFALVPNEAHSVAVLTLPQEEPHAAVLALLSDGESWSSSALALALGTSQRTVQRSLESLAQENKIRSFGKGRALRWTSLPIPGAHLSAASLLVQLGGSGSRGATQFPLAKDRVLE